MSINKTFSAARRRRLGLLLAMLAAALTLTFPIASADDGGVVLRAKRDAGGDVASAYWSAYSGGDFDHYQLVACTDAHFDGASCSETVYKSGAIFGADSTGPVTITGLDPQTAYGLILQIWRTGGDALKVRTRLEAPPPPTPTPLPPATPSGFAASAGDGKVTLSWENPSDDSITHYEYQQREEPSGKWGVPVAIPNSDANTVSHVVSGLTNGTEYRFKLFAVNSEAASQPAPYAPPWYVSATPESGASIPTPPTTPPTSLPAVPSIPSGLTATSGDGSVTLSWDDPSDSTITRYEYQMREAPPAEGWAAFTDIPNSGSATTSHTFTGLTNGTEYRFKLRAVNAGGPGGPAPSAEPWYVAATPEAAVEISPNLSPATSPLPDAPTGFRLIAGDQAITLVWDAADNVTGYEYQMQDATGGGGWSAWTSIPDADAAINSFGAIGLTNGNEYRFRLRAVNANGEGASAPTGDPGYAWEIAGMAVSAQAGIASFQDYDTDNDRLIEISTVQQLNAIRHDTDGNGSTNSTYQTAFPNAVSYSGTTAMGCPNTCQGYELNQHLDFDENGDGNRNDTYNTGSGWNPIGGYNTTLKGNGYVISNLYINLSSTSTSNENMGMFGVLNASAKISDFTLNDVDVYVKVQASSSSGEPRAGALAGEIKSGAEISFVSATGSVYSERHTGPSNAYAYAGGLVGINAGTLVNVASSVSVHAYNKNGTGTRARAGGIAGQSFGDISASYFVGHAKAESEDDSDAGGLVGYQGGSSNFIKASYSLGKAEAIVTANNSSRRTGGRCGPTCRRNHRGILRRGRGRRHRRRRRRRHPGYWQPGGV